MLATRQQRDVGRFTIKTRQSFAVQVASNENYGYQTLNIWSVLATNPQYQALKTLYDQIKINGVRIEGVCRVQPATNISYVPNYVYAWDRNGIELNETGGQISVYQQIASYGSSVVRPINGGTHNTFRTHLVAQDLQERILSISTDDVLSAAAGTASNLQTASGYFFKPVFMMGVAQPAQVTGATDYLWELEVSVDVTFRGTRYTAN